MGVQPVRCSSKAWILPLGLVLLVATNILRLVTLYLVGIHLPSYFDFMHLEVLPLVMVAVTVVLFLWAARLMKRVATRVEQPMDAKGRSRKNSAGGGSEMVFMMTAVAAAASVPCSSKATNAL